MSAIDNGDFFIKFMSSKSFIYRHILIYRFIMDILYLGKYKKRFAAVIDQLKNVRSQARVLELCFGDIYIADFCKKAGFSWVGIDMNENFVKHAQKSGHEAYYRDLAASEDLPTADVCIMMGSLYHFHPHTATVLAKMLKASNVVVLSEPVSNLSSQNGLIGFLARRAANAGKGNEEFRYNATSLMAMLNQNSITLNYTIAAVQHQGRDMIVKLTKNGND